VDTKRFDEPMRDRLVRVAGIDPRTGREYDHVAFDPPPLPSTVDLSPATWMEVTAVTHALGQLAQATRQVPNPALLRRPVIWREAQSTSALEGTYALLEDVIEADVTPGGDDMSSSSPALREVMNYVALSDEAIDWVREGRKLTVGLLGGLQARLFRDTPSEAAADTGRIRRGQVVIGPKGMGVEEARFVPPPPGGGLESALQDLLDWMEAEHDIPPVVRAALAHYQFECLHPFTDGNGRLGRLIIVLQLIRAGVIEEGILSVSPWFEERRRDYQDHLLEVSHTGSFDHWVRFFCRGLRARAHATTRAVSELLAYADELRDLAAREKLAGTIVHVLNGLIRQPILTARSLAEDQGVSPQTAYSVIERLCGLGVLTEITGRSYGRVFAATRVLEIVRQ
jgi:Fic family protein